MRKIERFVGKMGHQKNGITFHFRSMSIETRGVVLTHLSPDTHLNFIFYPIWNLPVYYTCTENKFWALALHSMGTKDRRCLDIDGLQPHNVYWDQHGSEPEDTCTRTVSDSRCKHRHQKWCGKTPKSEARTLTPAQRKISGNAGIANPSIFFSVSCAACKTTRESQPHCLKSARPKNWSNSKRGKKNRMFLFQCAMAFGFPVVHATISCCRAASLQQHPGRPTAKVPMHLFITNVDDGHSTGMLWG